MTTTTMSTIPPPSTHTHTYILITGANSGLGFSICCRLIDEFLSSRPKTSHLHLIPTVRTVAKAEDTTKRLKAHLASTLRTFDLDEGHESEEESDEEEEEELLRYHLGRVSVTPELVDLTDLVSVRALAVRLLGGGGGGGAMSRAAREEGGGERGRAGAGKIPKLDAVIWNAGIGGWLGINTLQGMWGMATDLIETVTRPRFKIGSLGRVCRPLCERYPRTTRAGTGTKGKGEEKMDKGMLAKSQQTASASSTNTETEKEPPLGEIFTANVFGHYMLGHYLAPLIVPHGGRIIWVSSVEADLGAFDANVDDDIMGLTSSVVYEDMKRLVDLLALTADLEGTRALVDGYFAPSASLLPISTTTPTSTSPPTIQTETLQEKVGTTTQPEPEPSQQQNHNMYLTHPGICMTEVLPQPIYIKIATFFVIWLARLLGSIWHPIQPYKGAVSAVWVALADAEVLEAFEDSNPSSTKYKGKGKYGSATNRRGTERVERTEVDGWGYDGMVRRVEQNRLGRWRGAVDLTKERRVEFEEAGRRVWRRMEELRVQWEGRVEDVVRGMDG